MQFSQKSPGSAKSDQSSTTRAELTYRQRSVPPEPSAPELDRLKLGSLTEEEMEGKSMRCKPDLSLLDAPVSEPRERARISWPLRSPLFLRRDLNDL